MKKKFVVFYVCDQPNSLNWFGVRCVAKDGDAYEFSVHPSHKPTPGDILELSFNSLTGQLMLVDSEKVVRLLFMQDRQLDVYGIDLYTLVYRPKVYESMVGQIMGVIQKYLP
jgi:hypothetical protein